MRAFKVLHLETTDVCQAACPLCERELDSLFDKNQKHHLTVNQILHHFDATQLSRLDKVFACGVYGDPAAGKHTMEIFKWFRKLNPDITLGMNTNGALRNNAYWTSLADLFSNPKDYVVFSIDGLEDTNHLYRKGVSWSKLIDNAKAFIDAGGSAHWDMLVYRHNEHQVSAAQALAKDLGFSWFRAKVSNRPLIANLEYPVTWIKDQTQFGPIRCHAQEEKSWFIDAQGTLHYCCWLAQSRKTETITDFTALENSWLSTSPHPICVSECGTQTIRTRFQNQWRLEVQLK